jgi:hypothetical protein
MKNNFQIKKSFGYPILHTSCNTAFLLPVLAERVVWLRFYMHVVLKALFTFELKILTFHSEQPPSAKTFCGFIPVEHKYHPISIQLTEHFLIFFLSSTEPLIQLFHHSHCMVDMLHFYKIHEVYSAKAL